jgi:predicted Zn-dependent protease
MLTSALLGVMFLQGQIAPLQDTGKPPVKVEQKQSKAEEQHQKEIDGDVTMGKKFVLDVEKQEKLSDNKEYQERVNRIGQEIAAIAQVNQIDVLWGDKRLNKFTYTFKVLKGDDVNAFSLPGGFIYVYEGLVKYAESDDELAAVLAHEVTHSEARHIATLLHDQQRVTTPGLIAILAAIVTRNPALIETAIMASQLTTAAFTSEWSVRAEQAADHGGFQYLLKSKYNPTAMLTFMERLALDDHNDASHQIEWGIYRTHPPGKERAAAVLLDMQKYGVPVQRSLVTNRFRAEAKPSRDGIDIWFNKRKLYTFGGPDAQKRADESAVRLNKFFDQEPNMFEVNFEGNKITGRRTVLIDVQQADADAGGKSTEMVGKDALAAIRGSLFNYAFNIWGTK